MKILYIGQYANGSTSAMRGECLKKILHPEQFVVLNTDIPVNASSRIARSFGWRFKRGPLISAVNMFLKDALKNMGNFDITWIDKGVFIDPEIIRGLRENGSFMIHYTPDTAFTYNRSEYFFSVIPYYHCCVTTKSFEKEDYRKAGVNLLILCTQGYDSHIHRPYNSFGEKYGVCFAGLYEPSRGKLLSLLLEEGFPVKLAGAKWEQFVNRHKKFSNLEFKGNGLFGDEYGKFLSGSKVGLGLLSKKFPELHTTRTFEIPACGTMLATEKNAELEKIFFDDEVIFFSDKRELPGKLKIVLEDEALLKSITEKGYNKVISGGFDYENILRSILTKAGIIQ